MSTLLESKPGIAGETHANSDSGHGASRRASIGKNRSLESAKLTRRIWRWHFYAGILSAPILLIAAITGCLYVFRAELEPIFYRDMVVVNPAADFVSYETQRAVAARAAGQDFEFQFVGIPPVDPSLQPNGQPGIDHPGTDRATTFWFRHPVSQRQKIVYVDPYKGTLTGSHYRDREFFGVVLMIHRTLFAGSVGRTLMELATGWGIVLVVTGFYLWFPRTIGRIRGVWVPRVRGKIYMTLRDLHAVPAVYLGAFLLAIMVTGLFFTNYWGQGFRAATLIVDGFPDSFVDPPKSKLPSDHRSANAALGLDQAITRARNAGLNNELSVSMPHDETDPIVISARNRTGPSLAGMIYMDQYSGQILDHLHADNIPAMTTVMLYALPIHQGSIFGLPTKLLAFAAALLLIGSTVTGALMWWQRRPQGTLGAPKRYEVALPRGIVGLIVLLSLCLPLVGVSLLVVLCGDWLWQRSFVT